MTKPFLFTCIFLLATIYIRAQDLQWLDPAAAGFPVIAGRGWQTALEHPYDRLPAKGKEKVRKEVWSLSKESAGEYISFSTSSNNIIVRYQVTGSMAMPHMPATGVSGVDLYAKDDKGHWHWARGNFSFDDTVNYRFENLFSGLRVKEFRLYLPLYNSVKWLRIGVPKNQQFSFHKVSDAQPVIFYGTSIMQGACATRPGLAWTNILGRRIEAPLINLGFSGNGRLEPELADLINEQPARLFVLDCQPNLHNRNVYTAQEIEKKIRQTIQTLRTRHPLTPILLTEHSCGIPGINMDSSITASYIWTSQVLNKTFHALKREGIKNLYLLTAREIGFTGESTVDGTHPNDIGMMQYANAYEKKILSILKK